MAKRRRAVVLLIDDDPAHLVAYGNDLAERATVIRRGPNEVTTSDLRKAQVVLIDYVLDDWPERDALKTVSLKPTNGVALAAVLRSNSQSTRRGLRAFAIHSGKLHELGGGLPAPSREHAIARMLNLEWVFPKGAPAGGPSMPEQAAGLAHAVADLPSRWPEDPKKASELVIKLLALPGKAGWSDRARSDVESCRPPAHSWATATNGLVVLRWLLHNILPYPCFLCDDRYLAARLRVSPQSLRQAISHDRKASRALAPARYRGALSEFLGSRWWRVGVEQSLWTWTGGDSFDSTKLKLAVTKHVSADLEHLDVLQPVVCVDSSFRPTDDLIDLAGAVEVRSDDWPVYADQAWVRRSTATDDPDLMAFVVRRDR